MNKTIQLISAVFGYLLLFLTALVIAEIIGRRFLGISLQGVDEMGGYILAIASGLSFSVALHDRAHIRIDMFHGLFGPRTQAFLNWLSGTLVAAMALLLFYVGYLVLVETIEFGSTAPTPWETPLIWPQSAWIITLALFALIALHTFVRMTSLILSRRLDKLASQYGPKVIDEELKKELQAQNARSE